MKSPAEILRDADFGEDIYTTAKDAIEHAQREAFAAGVEAAAESMDCHHKPKCGDCSAQERAARIRSIKFPEEKEEK